MRVMFIDVFGKFEHCLALPAHGYRMRSSWSDQDSPAPWTKDETLPLGLLRQRR